MITGNTINELLLRGEIEHPSLFPHLTRLQESPFIFNMEFGLDELPREPGVVLIRGARQYGKSTWLESQLKQSVMEYGVGSTFYLNGEHILLANQFQQQLEAIHAAYSKDAAIKRLFIDEITAIEQWEMVLKRVIDSGLFRDVLIVTTGSSATDLRRGAERMPGRKGKLSRNKYIFTPIAYKEFKRVCGDRLGEKTLLTYLISGGSPIACSELAQYGILPDYVLDLVRDWVDGEIARGGRSRSSMWNIMQVLHRLGTSPIGQSKLAREAGLANNTVAQGYIDVLHDLACAMPAYPWDADKKIMIKRKQCKYHFTNLLVALVYSSHPLRTINDFMQLPPQQQGIWYEWLVAQELSRRQSIQGGPLLEPLTFWQNKEHEIDFVDRSTLPRYIEVKRGKTTPLEFSWFTKQFPHDELLVISSTEYNSQQMRGINLEAFLLDDDG